MSIEVVLRLHGKEVWTWTPEHGFPGVVSCQNVTVHCATKERGA